MVIIYNFKNIFYKLKFFIINIFVSHLFKVYYVNNMYLQCKI